MTLSEEQKLIIEGLKICNVKKENIIIISLLLKSEEQQWQMLDFLETAVENPPSDETLLAIARRIASETE